MGLGGVEHRRRASLTGWVALVLALATLNYAGRFSSGKPDKDVLFHWGYAAGGTIEFALIFLLVLVVVRFDLSWLALRRPRSLRGAFGGALLVIVSIYALTGILDPILHPGREQGLTPDHWEGAHTAAFAANAFVVCVVAPFVEETTFRGVGYALIAERFGVEPAIVGSAVLFGLAHGLVEALPLLVAFGIGLAWLRERQKSTIPGMAVHGLFNALALLVSLTT